MQQDIHAGDVTRCWPASEPKPCRPLSGTSTSGTGDADQAKSRNRLWDNGPKHSGAPRLDNRIAETVAAGLGMPVVSLSPEQAQDHFGWFAMFLSMDLRASGTWTQAQLGWNPTGPGLVAALQGMDYSFPGIPA